MFVLISFRYHLPTEQAVGALCPGSVPRGGAFAIPVTAWVLGDFARAEEMTRCRSVESCPRKSSGLPHHACSQRGQEFFVV